MKIAFVYDRINKIGGAERILSALHELWPDAPLYTGIYDKSKAPWSNVFTVYPSFMNMIPVIKHNHELFPFISPLAFESFNFDKYDIVMSITSSDAKSIITKPKTLHICYCLTPVRYLWSGFYDYLSQPGVSNFNNLARLGMKLLSGYMRKRDYISSYYPDRFLAISQTVAKRIKKYYKVRSSVVYPPVDLNIFTVSKNTIHKATERYFLIVSRLVPYKKIDYVIQVFNDLGWSLKIIGNGIDGIRLQKLANKNIKFIDGNLTDKKLCWYYQNCTALIFPGVEDFGLTAVEAQACGKPVIAYNKGGVSENIIPGKTGLLYDQQNKISLLDSLKTFNQIHFRSDQCRQNARKFSKYQFQMKIKKTVADLWLEFSNHL